MKDTNNQERSDLNSFSPTLITTYSQKAVSTIRSIERILYLLLSVLVAFALLVLIDTAAIKGYIQFLSDDEYDVVLSLIALIAIGIMIFLLRIILRTRRKLDNWAYVFEKNSIGSLISIGLSNLDKRALLFSIVENIGTITEPIKEYIFANNDNIFSFLDQKISDKTYFDILIDSEKIRSSGNDREIEMIISKLNEYGSIIGKIISHPSTIQINEIKSFIQAVLEYSKSKNRFVGLALLVGNEVSNEAMEYAKNYSNKSIGYLIIIEKPGIISSV
ncbi:MAG TPA: hypothetical protein VFG45_10515 [Candidatus Nitrosocosmicus sp.]|jgi:hypothetical protein|uniref:hypothetical protein n=1 Tax=Candidatus Nitrosocosmicus agrestis TaxID=2563600 RepID=UPI00122DCBF2|nr:hypothetical protein [Candidatus Nitrosocosmicus sp. SS]KAA2283174.1 hypothetical protein F1Z66_03590 [Candidatus Nitrosocosmicus sp. SS]KAF0868629.1 hypothetical protein E5N71_09615 [Candidatus Nitrosocosmicus sp. SS]HET6590582.1 hypothetical protein [Candidatus Nitrosocosmicus sp.]